MEDLPLCLSSLYIRLSNKKIIHINLKKKKDIGLGPGAVAQVVKVLTLHAQDPIWAPVLSRRPRFPSSSLPVARENSPGWPKALEPCTRVGDPPGRGSWLWIGIASAIVLTWGVNHRTEDFPLCLSSLHI